MTTEKQRQNLRRGGIQGTPESAARAREAKADLHAEVTRVGDTAREDVWAAYDQLHAAMAQQMARLLQQELRDNSKPDRNVTDRLREFRQTTQALTDYRGSHRTVLSDAKDFFDQLDQRMANLLGEDYPERLSAHPLADLPAEADEPRRP